MNASAVKFGSASSTNIRLASASSSASMRWACVTLIFMCAPVVMAWSGESDQSSHAGRAPIPNHHHTTTMKRAA